MSIREYLLPAISGYKIQPSEQQLQDLELYRELLADWNEKINLTAITDEKGVAVKHFTDSMAVFNYIDIKPSARVIDVGTGAGFPGIVMKLMRPDIELTLLDSLKKRFLFIDDVLSQLNITATCIHGRAEELGQSLDHRESYDVVVSRAVAQLNTLSEYCLPLTRLSGTFAAFKGSNASAEIDSAKKAVQTLGGKIKQVHTFQLWSDEGERSIVEIEKNAPTPDKYPRTNGKIKTKPL